MALAKSGLVWVVALGLCACKSAATPPREVATSRAPVAAPEGDDHGDRGDLPVAEEVTYASTPAVLRGYLYRPKGAGPFPAVVFNHGSEPQPSAFEGQALFYVPKGFVLFVPHRRGQGLSEGAGEYINKAWRRAGQAPEAIVPLLEAQVDDVAAAVAYVRGLPFIDTNRVALAGCSFGGIETLLAAERDTGARAAVDFAGGAIIWARTAPLQERMKRAARQARIPVFFLQAENDYDTSPSRVLSEEMRRARRPMRVHIFPPNGTTPQEGHGFCRGGRNPPWGPEVLAFLNESMPPARPR